LWIPVPGTTAGETETAIKVLRLGYVGVMAVFKVGWTMLGKPKKKKTQEEIDTRSSSRIIAAEGYGKALLKLSKPCVFFFASG